MPIVLLLASEHADRFWLGVNLHGQPIRKQ
jgi:hypothetical protein